MWKLFARARAAALLANSLTRISQFSMMCVTVIKHRVTSGFQYCKKLILQHFTICQTDSKHNAVAHKRRCFHWNNSVFLLPGFLVPYHCLIIPVCNCVALTFTASTSLINKCMLLLVTFPLFGIILNFLGWMRQRWRSSCISTEVLE